MINVSYEEMIISDNMGDLLKVKRNPTTGKFSFSPVVDATIKTSIPTDTDGYKVRIARSTGIGGHRIEMEEESIMVEIKSNVFEIV